MRDSDGGGHRMHRMAALRRSIEPIAKDGRIIELYDNRHDAASAQLAYA
jgi:hypothetical protein